MRAFVIGNGPSLNDTPIALLKDEFTVGCNRFDLLGLDWNPDIWVMADVRHEDGWWDWDDLLGRDSHFIFRINDLVEIGRGNYREFFPPCEHIGGDYIPTSWHLPTYCNYGGSISIAMQAALLAGATEIYLVGCDLYDYRGPQDHDINHFHPEYCPYKIRKSTGEEMNGPEEWERLNRRLILGHTIARDTSGVPIFNATVGGKLEVYPRVDIFEITTK
jgi:hypothetical protein